MDILYNSNKKYTFTIKLLSECLFLAIGVCDKEIIKNNNYEYDLINKKMMKK